MGGWVCACVCVRVCGCGCAHVCVHVCMHTYMCGCVRACVNTSSECTVFSEYSEQLARQLHQAVEDGDINRVKDLLGQGANPNHQLYWSEEWRWMLPPLHGACEGGYLEMVKILVNAGAAIDKGDFSVL